jgi:hypothetical protein
MFERFRRSHAPQTAEGSVATRDPELDEREDRARFDRAPMEERGDTTAAHETTALDRDSARDDLGRDETGGEAAATTRHDEEHHHGRDAALAAGGAAAGAAAMHHHEHREAEREEAVDEEYRRDDVAAFHDDETRRDAAGEPTMLQDRPAERPVARERDLDGDGVDDGLERHDPVLAPAALETMRARQRDTFGGIQWGSDFFGWLCAIGLASLLTAALVGAGVALGLSTDDAARQGVGVWLWTLLAAVVVAAVALIGGNDYDVFQRLNLPRIAVGDSTLNAGGAIAGAAAVVVTLLFAVIGGKLGERFHRRVDRVATAEYVVERER